jgi:hypothetical protein
MKTVRIQRHEFVVESTRLCFQPGESFTQAFDTESIASTDLVFAALLYVRAIEWAWLRWHLDHNFGAVKEDLVAVVQRTVKAMKTGKYPLGEDDERGLHDVTLMYCAILSGDSTAMKSAAEQVQFAIPKSTEYQHDAAVAGILASRVLGDPKRERTQFELEQQRKANGVHPYPSKNLLKAFIERDYASLQKEIDKAVKIYSSDTNLTRTVRVSGSKPVVVQETDDLIIIDTMQIHPHFRWPYVQAAFAKLSMLDGASILTDDFWFPLAFVKTKDERDGSFHF